jgi:hypothetical protein
MFAMDSVIDGGIYGTTPADYDYFNINWSAEAIPTPPGITDKSFTNGPYFCPPNGTFTSVAACTVQQTGSGDESAVQGDLNVMSRFVISFSGWVPQNVASVWFRNNPLLIQDSLVTDIMFSGLNSLPGGGDLFSVAEGAYQVTNGVAFFGDTQSVQGSKQSPFTDPLGPVNPESGLSCQSPPPGATGGYCALSGEKTGNVIFPYEDTHWRAHYFDIYDGPQQYLNNSFFNIKTKEVICNTRGTGQTTQPFCIASVSLLLCCLFIFQHSHLSNFRFLLAAC